MNSTWFLIPMAAAVSLVWNCSRFEDTQFIIRRSVKMFVQIVGFMLAILLILAFFSYKL